MRQDRSQVPLDTRVAEPPRPPMDLASIAAVMEREGVTCRIRDYPMEQKDWDDYAADLIDFKPEVVIISTTTPTVSGDLKAAEIAKQKDPKIRVIAKGAYFLVFDKEILAQYQSLDLVIRGEPELSVRDIVQGTPYAQILGITFRSGTEIIRNEDRPFNENLDDLPFPARHLLNNQLYLTPDTREPIAFIESSRGCFNRCVFCAARLVSGNKMRMRCVDSVFTELKKCVHDFGFRNFFFLADTFTWHKEWVVDLCKKIVNEGLQIRWGANSRIDSLDEERLSWMKNAGCYVIGFGAESASQYMLDKMHKKTCVKDIESVVDLCRRYGIESYLMFVIGLPWETAETIQQTVRFVKKTKASFIEVNLAYPLPGTDFYIMAKENCLFNEDELIGSDHSTPLVRSFSLDSKELDRARKKVLRAFYLRPAYMGSRIAKIRSWRVAWAYCVYAVRLVKNILWGCR
ncbi:MAG: B12-binding domain-containing radical SAM protein [Candidatus Omnitrophica bacterium]|nr:B12-binding domain-containing radical SAM protein [Candidatus Omnitrophota bacterium]